MQNNKEHRDERLNLVIAVLSEEATAQQWEDHKMLLKTNHDYQELFNHYQRIWEKVLIQKDVPEIDVDKEWSKIENKLFKQEPKIKPAKKANKWIVRIAAALIIGILGAVGFLFITMEDYTTYSAENKVVEKELPDGTSVTLNHHTKIKFPSEYNKKERLVKLEGDAFFEVKPHKEKPFLVEANKLIVEALGTAFYVHSYQKKHQVDVVVKEGTVAVYKKRHKNKKTILKAGEKGSFNPKFDQAIKMKNPDVNFLSWKTKKLHFDNEEFYKIIHKINKAYHANIVIKSEKIKRCRLTVSFEDQELDSVLKVLKEILDLKVKKKKKGQIIELRGKNCK